MTAFRQLICILLTFIFVHPASAGTVRVAIAANFTAAAKEIEASFEKNTGHKLIASYGSTGKLYAQIVHGAPFEIFLSADERRPMLMEKSGLGVKNTQMTYAVGKLVLWTAKDGVSVEGGDILNGEGFNRIAIANPKTAPYGAAAIEVLRKLDLEKKMRRKLVYGDNIMQTYQFAASLNAELGIVAKAQVVLRPTGRFWDIPQNLYTPIRQNAILLVKGKDNKAARDFMAFLGSATAREIIRKHGYGLE